MTCFFGKKFLSVPIYFFIKSENYWSIIYALCISVIKRLTHLFLVILLFPIAITFTITIITDLFNMPGKRKVNYYACCTVWHCGDYRKSCTANSVQCDTCNSWYHYQCQQLDLVDIEYLVTPEATFTCCLAEFGQYNQYSYEYPLRLRVVCYEYPLRLRVVCYEYPLRLRVVCYEYPLRLRVVCYEYPLRLRVVCYEYPLRLRVVCYEYPLRLRVVCYEYPLRLRVVCYEYPLRLRVVCYEYPLRLRVVCYEYPLRLRVVC